MKLIEKEQFYSAEEQLHEDFPNENPTNFNYYIEEELLKEQDIFNKIYKETENEIIDNIDEYAKKHIVDITKISILINAVEKELKEESSIDKLYSNESIGSISFSEYYSVDLEGLSRLYDLLIIKRKEIINKSVENIVNDNYEKLYNKIITNEEIRKIIKEKAEELLDFNYYITLEKEFIEEVKKDKFCDNEEKEMEIHYYEDIIDYIKRISVNKDKMIKKYQNDILNKKLSFVLKYDFEENKKIFKILEDKIINNKINNIFKIDSEDVVEYYCDIEKELYKKCDIIPESDAIEHLVKVFLDKNYVAVEDVSEEYDYYNQKFYDEMLNNMSDSEYYDYLDQEKRKRKNVEFFKVTDNNKKQDIDEFLAHVKIKEGGFDYYQIKMLFNEIYSVEKIKDVFSFIKKNNSLKIEKFNNNNNKKIYNELINSLWNYINKNNYYSFYKNKNYKLNKTNKYNY